MTSEIHIVSGEPCLTLEAVAEVYRVQTVWLREVYDYGLLGPGHLTGQSISIALTRLDHVATIVRLYHVCGADVEAIAMALASWPDG